LRNIENILDTKLSMGISTNKEFKVFFNEYYTAICRFAFTYMGNMQISEDIVQDAFLRTYEKRNEFENIDNAKAFLYTIAHNLCLDSIRHQIICNNYEEYVIKEKDYSEELTFIKEVTRQETIRLLHTAINDLPRQTRLTIIYTLEGHTNIEIAEMLHISVNSVKTLKKKGYVSLRKLLEKQLIWIILLNRFI
jgi:RNA polymerase sigma-70 factor (family 1)